MTFVPKMPDYNLSPYTGLTRQSWIEAGIYLLEGVFGNIADFQAPVLMPRREVQVTYPRPDAPEGIRESQRRAELFEGLARSLFIAAPLIAIDPGLTVCGYSVRDYYKNQILRACTPGDPCWVGDYEEQARCGGTEDPFRAFQQTVETCALAIGLWMSRDQIWASYGKEEKDRIAHLLSGYAHANTVPQNWRLFNMLDLAFLHMEGYPIDEEIMLDHAQAVLNYYAGDGWYRDGHTFDYYSCWAFNVYTAIWNLWYGYERAPYIAEQFEANSCRLMETYPDFFDRDGFVNLWGRSCIYRNAAAAALDANLLMRHPSVEPGLARRIASGALLQFLSRDDFLQDGIPALGFYGQFAPMLQGYSCAESPFWLGKAFLCLHLPENHPFWTDRETNGTWEVLKEKEVKETVLDGPALCFSNHQANGETILRTGKVVKDPDDVRGMWNYSRLCYNTKYPWEAGLAVQSGGRIQGYRVEPQQYVLTEGDGTPLLANATFWNGAHGGVLYRRQFFHYEEKTACHWMQAVNLADFAVPCGVFRVDKFRFCRRPVTLTLGAYGFPDNGTQIMARKDPGGAGSAIILKGWDHTGREKQLAMTIYDGWEEISYLRSRGTNPDSEYSIVAYAAAKRRRQYGYEPYVLISQVITKESHEDFTEDEIFPVTEVAYTDPEGCGGYGPVTVTLKDGTSRTVRYEGMEGRLML